MKTQHYDERDAFPYPNVRTLHLDSDIPGKISHASPASKVLRLARTTSEVNKLCNIVF